MQKVENSKISIMTMINKWKKSELGFRYMMLSRLKSDCDYFLGYGERDESKLWAGSVKEQIKNMLAIWWTLPMRAKPEWLAVKQIIAYHSEMKGNK